MTPELTHYLRSWLRLSDVAQDVESEAAFEWFAAVTAWTGRQKTNSDRGNDGLLTQADARPYLHFGLLLHLATIDPRFFDLAKRMTARTISRGKHPHDMYCLLAANLLEAEPPKQGQTKGALARDVACILGVAVATNMGLRPLQGDRGVAGPRSGCAKLVERVGKLGSGGFSYGMAESAWRDKEQRLSAAGFDETEVSEFFSEFDV